MVGKSPNTAGCKPIIKVKVDSREQISQTLRAIAGKQVLVMPRGCGSRKLAPDAGKKQLLILDMQKLNRVIKLAAADYYIRCGAGLKLADLFAVLKERNLGFPFLTAGATGSVGGMVASGRLLSNKGCFAISRWVLAVTMIMADGREATTGAVTFKSVAGYDLCKLVCGSFGTLGVITEVALRCYSPDGRFFGKDIALTTWEIPKLVANFSDSKPANTATKISRRVKHFLDPYGIFPIISKWNNL